MEGNSFFYLILELFNIFSVVLWEDQSFYSFSFGSHSFLFYSSNRIDSTWKCDLSSHCYLINHRLIHGKGNKCWGDGSSSWWSIFTDLYFWKIYMNIIFLKIVIIEKTWTNIFCICECQLNTFLHYIMNVSCH